MLAAQRGDAAAFQELVLSYDAMVMRVALALTNSENSAQEIYVRVFRDAYSSMNKVEEGSSVFVWIHRILVKHCIRYCRRNRGCFARSASRNLAEVLSPLPPTERVAFLLKHTQKLKVRTVAEIFRYSPEHIADVLQNASIKLRAQLKPPFHQIA